MIPGKMGVGYTTIKGTEIEEFAVEILAVLPNSGPSGDLILVEVSGDVIDQVGGIASGMSGSPVYVDGQLLGAIGYGYRSADQRIGLVTPADDMLAVLELIRDEHDQTEEVSATDADVLSASDIVPLMTPIALSGYGQRSTRLLTSFFERRGTPVVSGSGPLFATDAPRHTESTVTEMLPGSPIAVQMVTGDVNMSAIGTLTAVDNDRFIAFGHTMSSLGDVSILASGASIARTVSSPEMPFKIGIVGNPVGTVLQDRNAAIGGRFGDLPVMTQLSVSVDDTDRGRPGHNGVVDFKAEVIADDSMMTTFVVISAFEAFDRGLDRLGDGTASIRFEIEGDGLPRPLVRENFVYSSTDVAARSLWELYDALRRLQSNLFQAPEIRKISLDATVSQARKTAWIEQVTPVDKQVAAGEDVYLKVRLQPYRAEPVHMTLPLNIPHNTAPGPLTVTVRGGDQSFFPHLASFLEEQLSQPGEEMWDDTQAAGAASFERLIEEIESQPKSSDIVFEFYPVTRGSRGEQGASTATSDETDEANETDETDETDQVDEADETGEADETVQTGKVTPSVPSEIESPDKREEIGNDEAIDDADDGSANEQHEESFAQANRRFSPVQTIHPSDYVIHGLLSFEITVTLPNDDDSLDDIPK